MGVVVQRGDAYTHPTIHRGHGGGDFRRVQGETRRSGYVTLLATQFHTVLFHEREGELCGVICIMVGKFKDEAENNLDHMRSLLRLSGPPFQCVPRVEDMAMAESSQAGVGNGQGVNNAQDEAKSSRRR